MTQPTEKEALRVMLDGARMIIEHATAQWHADKYKCGDEVRRDQLAYWAAMRDRVNAIGARIRADLKANEAHDPS